MASHQRLSFWRGRAGGALKTSPTPNRNRDFRVFSGLFEVMLAGASRGVRRKMADAVRLINSTGLRLAGVSQNGHIFLDLVSTKAHVVSDPDFGRPVYHADGRQRQWHCRRQGDADRSWRDYVFDLGYYDFGFWTKLDALGCRLVTRFKANTPLNKPREMPLEPGSTLLSDRIGFLPAPASHEPQERGIPRPVGGYCRSSQNRRETLRLFTNN